MNEKKNKKKIKLSPSLMSNVMPNTPGGKQSKAHIFPPVSLYFTLKVLITTFFYEIIKMAG